MEQFIISVEVDLIQSKFKKTINFTQGLNIISGENGTFKTKLIQAIRTSAVINNKNPQTIHQGPTEARVKLVDDGKELNAIFISPKRNSEKRSIESIFEKLRNQMPHLTSDMTSFNQFEDTTFKTYPSFGELYYKLFAEQNKHGGAQIACMNNVLLEFNQVIKKIFSEYQLTAEWSKELGRPEIKLDKGNRGLVPIESISLGEQEILSLVLNLYDNRNSCDTIFIDEPETHLNWHLEEKLFEYLADYSDNFKKQLIVITHSRIIFWEKFLKFTQFLFWSDSGKIDVSNKPTEKIKRILEGEISEIIKLGDFEIMTIFVEDNAHEQIIKSLAKYFQFEINCIKCGNNQNVKSLYRQSKNIGEWTRAFFLVDGDNQGNEFMGQSNFIHLDYYCLENYFLNKEIIGKMLDKSVEEVTDIIIDIIKENKVEILKKLTFLEFLIERIVPDDLGEKFLSKLDASKILPSVIKKIGIKSSEQFYYEYVKIANEMKIIDEVLPLGLINLFKPIE